MKPLLSYLFILLISYFSYSQATTYDFPNPVDTNTKEIVEQEKKTYSQNGLFIDNQFDGARINALTFENDSTISIRIDPENEPINKSPWYAFRLWSTNGTKKIKVTLDYFEDYTHRYWPKISTDRTSWTRLSEDLVSVPEDKLTATLELTITQDTTWISAQPLETSQDVRKWSNEIVAKKGTLSSIGKSKKGRDLLFVRIGKGKKAVVLLCRQHPPEVTGYYAFQSFVETLVDGSKLSKKFLKKHTVLIYPLLNPDGVDMGHWRHSTGGIDLNRDWAYYRQPEIKQIADHIVKTAADENLEVVSGLDFHSTLYDVYYTTDRTLDTKWKTFTDRWLNYIEEALDNYEVNDEPSGLGSPVSKGWFITQFNIPGITYEIGDDTPIDFVNKKGKAAAESLMKVLLEGE